MQKIGIIKVLVSSVLNREKNFYFLLLISKKIQISYSDSIGKNTLK